MNTTAHTTLLACLGATALLLTACSKEPAAENVAQETTDTASAVVTDVTTAAVGTWDRIRSYTFEKKDEFAAGIDRMAAKTDEEVETLAMKTSPSREKAVAEYHDARAALKTQLGNLRETSSETWEATKEKTTEAWQAVQAAYEKVKNSTSS